jgi:predicted AAA+ superfamily ATPase
MFSAELVTLFSGRTSEIQVFPFDFNEICEIFFNHKTNEESLEKYLMQGGIGLVIPEYKDFNLVKKALVKIYASCIKNDIKARHTIRYSESLERLCEYLFNNVGRKVSANNLENYLVSNKEIKISKNTIINYFN